MPEKLLQHDWIGFHAWARGAFRAGAHGDDGMCWEVADRGGNGILDELPSHPTAQVPIADAQLARAHGEPMATRIPRVCCAELPPHAASGAIDDN